MLPQINIIKPIEPQNSWQKQNPLIFEEMLTKVNHWKNELKDLENKVKNRDDLYSDLESKIIEKLGISSMISESRGIIDIYNSYKSLNKSPETDIDLLQINNYKIDIEQIEKQIQENNTIIKNKEENIKKINNEENSTILIDQKQDLKKSILVLENEIMNLNFILEEREKTLNLSKEEIEKMNSNGYILSDDFTIMIENLLKMMSKTETYIHSRRTSIELADSNFEEMDQLEKDLNQTKKDLKKKFRDYEKDRTDEDEQKINDLKNKKKDELETINKGYINIIDNMEKEMKILENDNNKFNQRIGELEKIEKEIGELEIKLSLSKKEWDELWEIKEKYEKDLENQKENLKNQEEQLSKFKKPRKSAFR